MLAQGRLQMGSDGFRWLQWFVGLCWFLKRGLSGAGIFLWTKSQHRFNRLNSVEPRIFPIFPDSVLECEKGQHGQLSGDTQSASGHMGLGQ